MANRIKLFGSWFPWSQVPTAEGMPHAYFELDEQAKYTFAQLLARVGNATDFLDGNSDGSLKVCESGGGRVPYSWNSGAIIPGGTATLILPSRGGNATGLVSVTGAQPVVYFVSFDSGATFSTNFYGSIGSLTTAAGLIQYANGIRFQNNHATVNATVQVVGISYA